MQGEHEMFQIRRITMSAVGAVLVLFPLAFGAGARATDHAVLVAIQDYEMDMTGFPKLGFSHKGASALRDVLDACNYQVTLLSDRELKSSHLWPSRQNIVNEVARCARAASPGDRIIVYLTGHGVTKGTSACFCPAPEETDYEYARTLTPEAKRGLPDKYVHADLLPYNDLLDILVTSPADAKFVFVDACREPVTDFNQVATLGDRPKPERMRQPAVARRTVRIFYSCGEDQYSYEDKELGGGSAVFTHYLNAAFRRLSHNGGFVKYEELEGILRAEVGSHPVDPRDTSKRQYPFSSVYTGDDKAIIMARGRQPGALGLVRASLSQDQSEKVFTDLTFSGELGDFDQNFFRAKFRYCKFQDCTFNGASFERATFTGCVFERCKMDHVTFASTIMRNCSFERGTNFRDSRTTPIILDGWSGIPPWKDSEAPHGEETHFK
jgi:hypothetical protein